MTDIISRADAIEAVESVNKHYSNEKLGYVRGLIKNRLMELPSADAVSREDADMLVGLRNFKEYIRGYNSATADAVQEWIPCSEKLPNEDEKVLVSGEAITEEILISKGEYVRYWHNKGFSLAWQPLPKPYNGCRHEGVR